MATQEIKIVVPKNWSAITLRHYLEMQSDLKAYEGEPEAQSATLFYHLCNITPDLLLKIDTETFTKIKDQIFSFVGNTEQELTESFIWEGKEYAFFPNLSKLEYGAYLDISKLNSSDINEDWAKVMSILYRPVTKRMGKLYDVQPYSGDWEWEKFLDMGMDLHFGAWFFFINLSKDLLNATLNSLIVRKDMPANIKQVLEESGVATLRL
jgi:hypothetical protein